MVAGFRRSFSLPGSKQTNKGRPPPSSEKSFHARSTSLPSRSHPIVSKLEDDVRAVKEWQSRSEPQSASPAWLLAGMSHLELLLDSMHGLLHLPQLHDSLRCGSSAWIERVLDDFLRFADASGLFRSAAADLKEHQSAARAAFRRRNEAQLAACIRSQKKIEKELFKLSSEINEVSKSSSQAPPWPASSDKEAELAGIVREASAATAAASASIFLCVAAGSATTSAVATCSRSSWMVSPLRRMSSGKSSRGTGGDEEKEEAWRKSALEKLEGLEECIATLEARNERVFRTLLNIRVSLLNILTPSI